LTLQLREPGMKAGRAVTLALVFFMFTGSFLFAQKKGSQGLRVIRMEVASGNTDNFHPVPMGQNGLLVFYETNRLNQEGKRLWYFALFDIHLKQKWLRPVPLTDNVFYIGQKQSDNNVYLVFRNTGKIKKGSGFYDILVYDMKKEVFRSVQGTMPLKADIADFAASRNFVLLGLNLQNNKADALFVNTETGNIHVEHLTSPEQVYVDGVFTNPSNGTFVLAANSADAKSQIKNTVYGFLPDGKPVQQVDITYFDPMSRLSEFTLARASGNNLKFFGAYHINLKGGVFKGGNDEDHPDTEGFFFLDIENGKQKKLKMFNFLDFKNIQGTFTQSEFHRTKSKNAQKPAKTVSLLNITHPRLAKIPEGYLVSADAYVPYYKTESHLDYDFYGNMYPTDYRVFAGYRFYDVILGAFSPDGEMLWDNDFPIENIISYRIGPKTLVYPDSTLVTLAYVTEGQIITQDIYKDKKIDEREKIPIANRYSRDRPVGAGESRIIHWYGHYFLVYGYQQLKNRALQNQPLRTVFYVNKVAFQ
jgi:hypothetical protein